MLCILPDSHGPCVVMLKQSHTPVLGSMPGMAMLGPPSIEAQASYNPAGDVFVSTLSVDDS
jgi:hypothetical protein